MSDPIGIDDLEEILNNILHKNQKIFTIHACLHKNFLFVTTMKRSLSVPLFLTNCSNTNAITNPMAKM
tara:strand:- start:156 stop:359 length:204 start_codon:yes stop_codon:yes gene_type:complete